MSGVVSVLPGMASQASSDAEMLDLWLGKYRRTEAISRTEVAYTADARAFLGSVGKPLRAITVRDIQDFAAGLAGLAPATIARRLSAVKSLFGFAHQVGYVPFDVSVPIALPPIKDRLSERILSEADVQHMIRVTAGARNSVIVRLLYGAGLRISEVCGLCWSDVAPRQDGGQITVFGKGGHTRHILLPAPLYDRICALRGAAGDDAPVFRSRKGGALRARQVHDIIKSSAKRARLSPKISAHYLRHSHCSHALDRGAPVHVVQQTLGHASLTTTTRYSHARPGDSSARYLAA